MIGGLKGQIAAIGEGEALIDVHGVVYLVGGGARTLRRLAVGQAAHLHIETEVRDDAIRLWAFLSEEDRAWFVLLKTVQGIGSKAALAILDALPPAELMSAAALGDVSAVTRAQGVGRKLAERVVTELKDKPPPLGRSLGGGALRAAPAEAIAPASALQADAISALVNLGYQRTEAAPAVASASRALGDDAALDALIARALKELARG
jgi:Holliday junction DNA helicase RuvA